MLISICSHCWLSSEADLGGSRDENLLLSPNIMPINRLNFVFQVPDNENKDAAVCVHFPDVFS